MTMTWTQAKRVGVGIFLVAMLTGALVAWGLR